MRSFIRATVLGAVSILALGAAAQAKTLVYCSEGSPEGFAPMLFTAGTTFDASSKPVYNRLVEFERGDTKTVPGLAESYTVSDDGLTYTFKLREGVKWHGSKNFTPSRDFNADDVVFTFMRQLDPNHPYHKVSGGTYEYFASMDMGNLLKSVEKVDDHTVKFTLAAPQAPFIANIAMDFASIMSAEYADAMMKAGTPEKLDLEPVGTGPFTLVDYQKDAVIRYKANPDYWAGPAKIDNLVFAITPDASVRYQKLKAGECQVMAYPNPADIPAMKDDPAVNLLSQEGLNIGYHAYNTEKKPFDDPRVRRALQMAIDRWGGSVPLAKIAIVGPVGGPMRPGAELALSPDELSKLPGYSRNIEAARAEAKKLLEEAGVKDLKLRLLNRNTPMPFTPVGVYIVDQWRRIGVTTEHQQLEVSIQKNNTQSGEFDAALDTFCFDSDDPRPELLTFLSRSKSPRNVAHNESPQADKLFEEMKATTDPAARKKIAADIQRLAINEGYAVPVIWYSRLVAHSSAMKGWKAVPTHFVNQDLAGVWLDQ